MNSTKCIDFATDYTFDDHMREEKEEKTLLENTRHKARGLLEAALLYKAMKESASNPKEHTEADQQQRKLIKKAAQLFLFLEGSAKPQKYRFAMEEFTNNLLIDWENIITNTKKFRGIIDS